MFGKVKSLRELFEIQLRYAYDCEQKLSNKGIPSMIDNAASSDLRGALQEHLRETQHQIARLDQVFALVGIEANAKDNDVLDELIGAAEDSVSNIEATDLRDAALIVNGNLVEHYEIALYGSLAAFARSLGQQKASDLLQETLQEEKNADKKLTQIAETILNLKAARSQTA
jgi:ferritin-like metal-binding protein YciE